MYQFSQIFISSYSPIKLRIKNGPWNTTSASCKLPCSNLTGICGPYQCNPSPHTLLKDSHQRLPIRLQGPSPLTATLLSSSGPSAGSCGWTHAVTHLSSQLLTIIVRFYNNTVLLRWHKGNVKTSLL